MPSPPCVGTPAGLSSTAHAEHRYSTRLESSATSASEHGREVRAATGSLHPRSAHRMATRAPLGRGDAPDTRLMRSSWRHLRTGWVISSVPAVDICAEGQLAELAET